MSIKSRKARWPKQQENSGRKTSLRVIRGGRATIGHEPKVSVPRADAYREPGAVEMFRDLGDIAPQLVEKAAKFVESSSGTRRALRPASQSKRRRVA